MNRTETAMTQTVTTIDTVQSRLRHLMTARRILLVAAFAVIAGGIVANWGWLVAVGIAPLILGTLPCVAMCALGLCASSKCKK